MLSLSTLACLTLPFAPSSALLSRRAVLALPIAMTPTSALAFQTPALEQFSDPKARALAAPRPNPELSTQQQAAFFAITNNDLLTLQKMIDSGWDLAKATDTSGKTSLHRAAQLGNADAINILVKAGVPLDPINTWQETPLHIAARNGCVAAVKTLLDAGASTSAQTFGGDTAMSLAQKYKKASVVELLASK
eukprot:scaffold151963_cov35-Tisochrysis_lutea.AAC.1